MLLCTANLYRNNMFYFLSLDKRIKMIYTLITIESGLRSLRHHAGVLLGRTVKARRNCHYRQSRNTPAVCAL